MSVAKVLLLSAATTLVLISVLIAAFWGYAHQRFTGVHGYTGGGALMRGHQLRGRWFSDAGRGGEHESGCARLSETHVAQHIERLHEWVAAELDLDAAQQVALAPVLGAGTTWTAEVRSLCAARADDAAATVSLLSSFSGASDAAVKQFSAAFKGFYATLRPAQQHRLDEWLRWPALHDLQVRHPGQHLFGRG